MKIELMRADVRLLLRALESEQHAVTHGQPHDAEHRAQVEHIYALGQKLRRALESAPAPTRNSIPKPRCQHRDDGRGRCIDCDEFI